MGGGTPLGGRGCKEFMAILNQAQGGSSDQQRLTEVPHLELDFKDE